MRIATIPKTTLDYVVVEDISIPNAFHKAVVSDPPFDAVVHTASPYHFKSQDNKKYAWLLPPHLRQSLIRADRPRSTPYSEADWCPVTEEQALANPADGYRASKTFAERAAWKFVEDNKPNFTLAVCNPPLVLGPVLHHQDSLASLNTSNERILMSGASKPPPADRQPPKDEAAGKRFFMVGGHFLNKQIAEIIGQKFPELKESLPTKDALKTGDYPAIGPYGFDSTRSKSVLGMTYRPLEESILDAVKSLQGLGA
ncbi:hypothetical protein KVR01_013796 [Diaporthe batatas]|uniref:uncharacterized protein n=1 Tax=Diaporthe batatas TaxID=748121 RepID=UPI001D047A04|nr:uncharacterized protein KVR01_013796 [Diaporthe batatas]KAG8156344.1 hypothetical protein KVR01_013796 [Diaporthe batatas]